MSDKEAKKLIRGLKLLAEPVACPKCGYAPVEITRSDKPKDVQTYSRFECPNEDCHYKPPRLWVESHKEAARLWNEKAQNADIRHGE